ncbi:MAG: valine--tRNA ligase [Pseudomonadota bacterium]
MAKTYEPEEVERSSYQRWEESGFFQPGGSGESYCIMLPPPNVTGNLHMGHAFQDTLMDALIRYQRMKGRKTLWQCGTDHAGIATQMVVERQLAQRGSSRHELGRDRFIDAVWKWKEESGGAITRQLRRMGASMDWSRERFTLDAGLSEAVTEVFVRLYEDGLIYRGKRLVNWDPVLHTAISDLEVVSTEEQGSLWHIRYPLADEEGHLVVATTRPETMLGDTAVAVHPDDDRYKRYIGKDIVLPLSDRRIPIIADDYVDPEFGSGCVKITPAHDFNDYQVGERHGLPIINVFNDDASINDEAPLEFQDLDRYAAREKIVTALTAQGLLVRTEDHTLMVPRGDRTQAVIEPYLTDQWFVRIAPLAEPAIKAVEDGAIRFIPNNWEKTYFEWMRNIEDWCISRQLWWGHRIPAWYTDDGKIYVGRTEAEARRNGGLSDDIDLRQDEDVLDTWFSSALWPFSTLGWPSETEVLKAFYPTSVLVTGFDIIFFWVARMIMMGLRFMDDVPFREVYIHGLVRDADGNKMSKSKGNILDPLDLIDGVDLPTLIDKRTSGLMRPQDAEKIRAATERQFGSGIERHGTDALRFTFAAMATQGRDIRFDLGRIGGYRNFCNKLWNASRFVMMQSDLATATNKGDYRGGNLAARWIESRLSQCLTAVEDGFTGYRFDLASQSLYEFVWDEYCDWYIEFAKAELLLLNDHAARAQVLASLKSVLDASLRALHPLVPYISEEIWRNLNDESNGSGTIMLQPYPDPNDFALDADAEQGFGWLQAVVMGVRRIRSENGVEPNKRIPVLSLYRLQDDEQEILRTYGPIIEKLTRVENLQIIDSPLEDAATALAGNSELYVPIAGLIDREQEQARLEKDIAKLEKEVARLDKKLANSSFLDKAPAEVVSKEQAKRENAQSSLATLKSQLGRLRA